MELKKHKNMLFKNKDPEIGKKLKNKKIRINDEHFVARKFKNRKLK